MSENRWTEDASEIYRKLAAMAVPRRAEQIATLLTLIPFNRDETFRVVELASGEGILASAVLTAYPHANLLALDGSESMLETTQKRLAPSRNRATSRQFDMAQENWYPQLEGADVVVSSLCVHHLDDGEKQQLFNVIGASLSDRGALLLADLVEPKHDSVKQLFAGSYDHIARSQAQDETMIELFEREEWNYYRYPDPLDKPSYLFDQLIWLRDAGFGYVDVFWMFAGHAIYGGYKSDHAGDLQYNRALDIAQNVLDA